MDKSDKLFFNLMIIFLLIITIISITETIGIEIERQTFNRLHHTDYTFWEWGFSKNIILDYTEGKEININLKQNGNK